MFFFLAFASAPSCKWAHCSGSWHLTLVASTSILHGSKKLAWQHGAHVLYIRGRQHSPVDSSELTSIPHPVFQIICVSNYLLPIVRSSRVANVKHTIILHRALLVSLFQPFCQRSLYRSSLWFDNGIRDSTRLMSCISARQGG